jgi:putative ABC transport system permease protein
MLRVVAGELLHRRHRTLALLAGILVATTSFTVLTATSRTQRLEARGTVAKSFRGSYDVLVRPSGSRTATERRTAQVQPNFLSSVNGGITVAQWRRIQRLPGVEVAAPVANIGYLLPTAKVRVGVAKAAGSHGRALLRARVVWESDRGLTRVPDAAQYAYVSDNRLRKEPYRDGTGPTTDRNIYRRFALREEVPGQRRPDPVCNYIGAANPSQAVLDGPFETIYRSQFGCFSRRGMGQWQYPPLRRTRPYVVLRWAFPLLLTAVDPVSEARLTGLDRAVVDGRYLRPDDRAYVARDGQPVRQRFLPVLAASRTFVDEQAQIAVEQLGDRAAARWARPFPMSDGGDYFAATRYLIRLPHGPVVQRVAVPAEDAYRTLLRQLRGSDYEVQYMPTIWRIGPTQSTATQPVDDFVWQNNAGGSLSWAYAPPTGRDTRFREVTRTAGYTDALTTPKTEIPLLRAVGTFDPNALGTAPAPGAAPLSTLQPPLLTARDDAAAKRLGGQPLLPNGNLGGYLAQPPALLTTMQAARAFGPPTYPELDWRTAISAVRVRVAGVEGIDALSRERIRQAAERIAASTGLEVDITAGASGAPTAIDLPAGLFGRPRLALSEVWIRKGVAARILSAVDRKSLLLFVLILVVCALFVGNAASAAVRARRTELGVLSALGWSTWRLFAVVLAEAGAVGLAAGVLGGLLARTLGALAPLNLLRTPGRTALGALSLAIGVCALTLLLAATVAFNDVLVGTLLGDTVAVRVRSTDYIAVIATVLLGVGAVADVLFIGVRERAAELATLAATGWDEHALGRLVALEGVWIGALGATSGAGLGLLGAALFAGALPLGLVLTTLAAAAGGTAIAALAALAPAAWLRRMPLVPLLADE